MADGIHVTAGCRDGPRVKVQDQGFLAFADRPGEHRAVRRHDDRVAFFQPWAVLLQSSSPSQISWVSIQIGVPGTNASGNATSCAPSRTAAAGAFGGSLLGQCHDLSEGLVPIE